VTGRENGAHGAATDGVDGADGRIDEARAIEAIESGHEFPVYFPIVVVARRGPEFHALLQRTVEGAQGDAPFRIRTRASRRGRFVSYHVEVFLESGREALARRSEIGGLPGVIVLL